MQASYGSADVTDLSEAGELLFALLRPNFTAELHLTC